MSCTVPSMFGEEKKTGSYKQLRSVSFASVAIRTSSVTFVEWNLASGFC